MEGLLGRLAVWEEGESYLFEELEFRVDKVWGGVRCSVD